MATVNSATNSAANSTVSSASNSRATMANNFDQFLSLLTTQLKNQSPLDPLDTNQFTQQLVQFASVEQQIKTNDSLSALVLANKTANITNALGFIGAKVTAAGNTSVLKSGSASWNLNAPRAGTAQIIIKDSSGNEVLSRSLTMGGGNQAFNWDGKRTDGSTAPDGQYTMTITARDGSGNNMTVNTDLSGTVDGVDVSGDTPILNIGGIKIPQTSVKTISR
ncbi:MAG: flagellar hook assembly protein FlgD [Proteobacteria bacterium]|nr:flagellar hook assembly protein FlgD [Pseudomonadota bacterium]